MGYIYRCPKCGYYDSKHGRCNNCNYTGWLLKDDHFNDDKASMTEALVRAEEKNKEYKEY